MVIKVKEITIGRGRKWAWNYGNGVSHHVSITIESTNVKDTVEDMLKKAIEELTPIEASEQDRCRFVYEGSTLLEDVEYKDKVEKSEFVERTKSGADQLAMGGNITDSKTLPIVAEVISTPEVSEEIQYDSKTFKNFMPCKYKCGMFTAWGKPYEKGDRKLHMNPLTKEIIGYDCPEFDK